MIYLCTFDWLPIILGKYLPVLADPGYMVRQIGAFSVENKVTRVPKSGISQFTSTAFKAILHSTLRKSFLIEVWFAEAAAAPVPVPDGIGAG
jgi:hypothetical protein